MNNIEQRAKERSRLLIRTALRLIASVYLIWLAYTQFLAVYIKDPQGKSAMYLIIPVIFIGAAVFYAVYAFRFYSTEIRRQVALEEEEEKQASLAEQIAEPEETKAPEAEALQQEEDAGSGD